MSYPTDDYARIKVTSASAAPTALVDRYGAGGDVTVMGSTRTAVQGKVCKSGKSTGWTCGVVAGFDRTVNYGEFLIVRGLTQTSICAEPGDSGGAVVSNPGDGTGVQAQGMVSGGGGNCTTGGSTFFQPVGEALKAYDLSSTPAARTRRRSGRTTRT